MTKKKKRDMEDKLKLWLQFVKSSEVKPQKAQYAHAQKLEKNT